MFLRVSLQGMTARRFAAKPKAAASTTARPSATAEATMVPGPSPPVLHLRFRPRRQFPRPLRLDQKAAAAVAQVHQRAHNPQASKRAFKQPKRRAEPDCSVRLSPSPFVPQYSGGALHGTFDALKFQLLSSALNFTYPIIHYPLASIGIHWHPLASWAKSMARRIHGRHAQ